MKNKVRELRERASLTQEQLGAAVGATRQTINAIEADRYTPKLALAIDIARVFNLPVEEVFTRDPQKSVVDAG